MYYEIYIDVFFISNFFTDYLLLLFLRRMMGCSSTSLRILLGAAVGAAASCVTILLPFSQPFLKLVIFHLAINTIMIKIAYRVRERRCFLELLAALYISSLLMGGILEVLKRMIPVPLFLFAVILSYYLMRGIGFFVKYLQKNRRSKCRVVLYTSKGKYELQALLDTGNGLVDTLSGKCVNIVDRELAEEMFSQEEMQTVRYVPFHSIGKDGVLPAVKTTTMWVYMESEKQAVKIEAPLIGISEQNVSVRHTYQIILNPDILGGTLTC